jgi:hypothetical protein
MIRRWRDLPGAQLGEALVANWAQQGHDGFLLSDPAAADLEVKEAQDAESAVRFRFRWLPHREIRGDVAELERRGILNPDRNEAELFRDPRDPQGRHCFLCATNVHECHPKEVLIPLQLAGRDYFAGANFAWIEPDHYTVMAAEHVDQAYSGNALAAMLELHLRTQRRFRVLFNGNGAGATIPWHLHYQITTAAMPIEKLQFGYEERYPTLVQRFTGDDDGLAAADAAAEAWLQRDLQNHSVNILVASPDGQTQIFVFPRDQRRAKAPGKGLVGGFEVAGDFVMSAPNERDAFLAASAQVARAILTAIRPQTM